MRKFVADSDEITTVTVNDVKYDAKLYKGVLRFVPNEAVSFIVDSNPYVLNDLAVAVVNGDVSLDDYIAFGTMHGYSVSGFTDSISSIVDMNPHIFSPADDHFRISYDY